jgi:hypothetical protein
MNKYLTMVKRYCHQAVMMKDNVVIFKINCLLELLVLDDVAIHYHELPIDI